MKMISKDELKFLLGSKGGYVLIDVRERDELKYGMIPGAKNLPLSELKEALGISKKDFEKKYGFAISKDERIIFYCRTGGRSAEATSLAESKGYQSENFKGSVKEWSEIDSNVKMY